MALFLVNIPFYALACRRLGGRFTLRTLGAVSALSVGVELAHRMLSVRAVDAPYAAVAGGLLIGLGLLVLLRHGASLGGVNAPGAVREPALGPVPSAACSWSSTH